MIKQLVQGKRTQRTAAILLVIWCVELCFPPMVHALTSGPTQPEVQAFTPAGSAQTVDITSGDFSYNIPLLEVPGPDGGYPINLAYRAGIGADQEATWVGLGWNLNPGAVNRQMRGIPDEFNGTDQITQTLDMKNNFSVGLDANLSLSGELFGLPTPKIKPGSQYDLNSGLLELINVSNYNVSNEGTALGARVNIGLGLIYNNSRGLGTSLSLNGGLNLTDKIVNENHEVTKTTTLNDFSKVEGKPNDLFKTTSKTVIDDSKNINTKLASLTGGINLDNINGPSISLSGSFLLYNASFTKNTRGLKQWNLGMNTGNMMEKAGYGIGTSISHTSLDYLPSLNNEMIGVSMKGAISPGVVLIPGTFSEVPLSASLSWSTLKYKNKPIPVQAYGYLHSDKATEKGLSDVNRYQDSQDYQRGFLAMPAATYDIYSATGQGFSGMFRPYRNEVGTYSDQKAMTTKDGGDFELEGGIGQGAQAGWAVSRTHSRSVYKPWEEAQEKFPFHTERYLDDKNKIEDPIYEPYHFRIYGEAIPEAVHEIQTQAGEPLHAKADGFQEIKNEWDNYIEMDDESDKAYKPHSKNNKPQNFRTPEQTRAQRTTVIQDIPNGLLHQNAPAGFNIIETSANFDRTELPLHHLGGFVSLTPSGTRYVYGLPNYNTKQEEYAFTVDAQTDNPEDVLLKLDGEEINYNAKGGSTDVNHKSQKYYQKKEVDKYAHSHLLTGILGADYIDTKGNGMDDEDLGGWIRFNYQTMHNQTNPFQWRAPFMDADYMQGLQSHKGDDKGSFLYGEKEIRYLRMVETASHVAYFFLSERLDGYGPAKTMNQSDKQNTLIDADKPLYKLDKIVLYSKDALKANNEWKNPKDYVPNTNWSDYFQDQIQKIEKTAPIKTVHFRYTYELCRGVPNNKLYPKFQELTELLRTATQPDDIDNDLLKAYSRSGKLTLKEVYFTYGKNERGKFSPYEFDYGSIEKWEKHQDQTIVPNQWDKIKSYLSSATWEQGSAQNPHYQRGQADMWGNYKPKTENDKIMAEGVSNKQYPYPIQPHIEDKGSVDTDDIKSALEEARKDLNERAVVWSMKQITLPSGGKIYIGYEADDYGYVQNQKAMQLMPIKAFGVEPKPTEITPSPYNTRQEEKNADDDDIIQSVQRNNRIYFQLPQPIVITPDKTTQSHEIIRNELKKYVDGVQQVYFRAEMKLKKRSTQEVVKGYANLDYDAQDWENEIKESSKIWVNTDIATPNPNGSVIYTQAYITLRPFIADGRQWHPFATAAWQFLQQFRPEIMYKNKIEDLKESQQNDLGAITKTLKDLGSLFGQVGELARGFYSTAQKKGWGREVIPNTAFIRLNNPNGAKIGGGHRVKYIITDDGRHTEQGIYGTVYDYTNPDGTSSGVATYEPSVGGEENPIRTAVLGRFNVQGKVFENPINEAYYPAPSVGYGRIRTQSLASYFKECLLHQKDIQDDIDYHIDAEEGLGERVKTHFNNSRFHQTSGVTENIFYTCKEFPVIVSNTMMTKKKNQPNLNLMLLSIQRQNTNLFQGYSIELNDMHLKPKRTATYGQKQDGTLLEKPISEVIYHYKEENRNVGNQMVRVPNNYVPVLYQDYNGEIKRSNLNDPKDETNPWMRLGHSEELFADARTWKEEIYQIGADANQIVIPYIPFTIPAWIPTGMQSKSTYRTHVTNKITHRSGVIDKVETHDGSAVSIAENVLWDAKTGQVLLTKVTNNFGNPIFSYNIPAHLKYDRMAHAYKNIGMKLKNKSILEAPTASQYYRFDQVNIVTENNASENLIFGKGTIVTISKGLKTGLTAKLRNEVQVSKQINSDQIGIFNQDLKLDFGSEVELQTSDIIQLSFSPPNGNNTYEFHFFNGQVNPEGDNLYIQIGVLPHQAKHLVLGDEFLIGEHNVRGIITHIEFQNNNYRITLAVNRFLQKGNNYNFYLYRSGRKNLLGASVGNVTTMNDPTDINNRKTITDQKIIQLPPCDSCEK